jgi:hypothetical protein
VSIGSPDSGVADLRRRGRTRGAAGSNQYGRVPLDRFFAEQRHRVQMSVEEHARRVRDRLRLLAWDEDEQEFEHE